jgi:cell division protein FtsW (lipid II flippase)
MVLEIKMNKNVKLEKQLLIAVISLIVINTIVYYVAGTTNKLQVEGNEGSGLGQQLLNFYIGFIFISVLISLFFSIIPYKKMSYVNKFLRLSLIIFLALNIFLLILGIYSILKFSI